MSRRAVAAATAALVLVAGCTGSSAGPSASEPTQSSTTVAGPVDPAASVAEPDGPGTLVDAEVLDEPGIDGTVWSVTYRSESVTGEPIEVTGLVARPAGPPPPDGHPVLSWAHGTTGVADACAPSTFGVGLIPDLQGYLDAGYVVAATDYEGLGTPGVHPYLVSASEGRGVLDAARAARALVPETADSLVVAGHSQGGHAALAAAEIADDWAPALDLVGTVAIAPAADLEVMVPGMFAIPFARAFAVLVAAGWADTYPDLDERDVLGPEGLRVAEAARSDACIAGLFGEVIGADDADLVVAGPETLEPWARRIAENTIKPDRVEGPVLLVQGSSDPLVATGLTETLAERLCEADSPVRLRVYDGADHTSVVADSTADVRAWLDARIAGAPPEPTCG